MINGKLKILFIGMLGCVMHSCSPTYRFNRLVEKYPFLLESKTYDSVRVVEYTTTDSIFYWEEIHDTITINGIRIERFRDTFRIQHKQPNCTTFINTTEIRPSKLTEKIIQKEKNMDFWIKALIVYMSIVLLVILIRK